MKKLLLILVCFALLPLSSCKKEDLSGEVAGYVYYLGTYIPVSGVTIKVDGNITTTDNDGEYLLKSQLGRFYLIAEKKGFESVISEIRIVEGINHHDIFLSSKESTSIIEGVVRGNHTFTPQMDLEAIILNPDKSQTDLRGISDERGVFIIDYVPRGERNIIILDDGIEIFRSELLLNSDTLALDIYLPEPFSFTDERDGNTYMAIKHGFQTWMIDNLAWLPEVDIPSHGSIEDKYYYVPNYFGDNVAAAKASSSYSEYGVLYNWVASKTACPNGWHLPSDEEWQILELYLGMGAFDVYRDGGRLDGEIGRKLKSTSGWNNNGNGNNSSKLNVLPVGGRFDTGGFDIYGERATFWTATESSSFFSWGRGLGGNVYWVDRDRFDLRNGLSVRCVKSE